MYFSFYLLTFACLFDAKVFGSVWLHTGPLCPDANLTFSDLPKVTRASQYTSNFLVEWQGGLENAGCASGLYVNWWKKGEEEKQHRADKLLDNTKTSFQVETIGVELFSEELFFQVVAFKDGNGNEKNFVKSPKVLFSASSQFSSDRGTLAVPQTPRVTEAGIRAPMVTQHRSSLLVKWQVDGSLTTGPGGEQYIVRWKTKNEVFFHESELLREKQFEIGNFRSGEDYVIQVVAVVEERIGNGDVFSRWIKSPTTSIQTTNSQSRPDQRPNSRPTSRPNPNQKPVTARLLSKLSQPDSSSKTPTTKKQSTTPFQPLMDLEEVEKIECQSGQNEYVGFKERGCVSIDDTRFRAEILKFVFDNGDSVFITIFASIFAAVGIILNMLVLVAVLNYPVTRRNATTPFILSITFSDLIYSAVILPIMAMRFHLRESPLSDTMCHLYPVIYYTVQGASLFSLTLVTLNRAAMLFMPERVEKIFTNHKEVAGRNVPVNSILLLAICWAIPFFGLLPTILGKNGCLGLQRHTLSCTILADSEGYSPKTMMYIVMFTIPTITIIATDIAIYFKMKEMQQDNKRISVRKEDERRAEKRFMMMLAAIFFVYVITYMPGFLVKTVDRCYTHPTLHSIAYVFNWASVWINPVIYIAAQKKYQDALRHLLPCFKSNRRTSVRTTKMKSFNLDSTDTTNSDSRRNTAAVDDSVVGVETRDKGSPSLVVKYISRVRDRVSGRDSDTDSLS